MEKNIKKRVCWLAAVMSAVLVVFLIFCHILVFADKKVPADLSVERLMQEHDSKPQNPIIANVLYKSKILESWRRGIGTMVDECKRVGLPAPEFKTDGNFVTVVFKYNRDGVNLQLVNSNPTSTKQVPNKYPTSTQQVPNKYWNLSEF